MKKYSKSKQIKYSGFVRLGVWWAEWDKNVCQPNGNPTKKIFLSGQQQVVDTNLTLSAVVSQNISNAKKAS